MFKSKTKTLFLLVFFLVLAVRFYNFPAWFGFDYDQEANALIAKTILVDHKAVLIGPETSVGGMYVGPYFNYIITAFYALGRMNPSWTILLNFFLSALTLIFIYFVGKKIFSPTVGLFAAILYGFSYNLTNFDRVSWNPTPIPLVSLAIFYFLYDFCKTRRLFPFIMATVATGFMFHLHFTAFFTLAFYCLALILFGQTSFRQQPNKKIFTVLLTTAVFAFPLLLFEMRHGFLILTHLQNFIVSNASFSAPQPGASVANRLAAMSDFPRSILQNDGNRFSNILPFLALMTILFVGLKRPDRRIFFQMALLLLVIPIIILALYKGPLPAHYFLFVLPVLVLSFSWGLGELFSHSFLTKIGVVVFFLWFSLENVPKILATQNGLALSYKQQAVEYVISDANADSFKVDFIHQPGRKTGFPYLFWAQGKELVEDMTRQTKHTYKIIVPYFLIPSQDLSARFGGIGVVKVE